LAITVLVLASSEKTLGVPPSLISKYIPSKSGNWHCLDGSKEIPWDFVNDDACDCPDGSDEPVGTAACSNNTFYCRNEGHIGATVPSSRVNDGLCVEPECCDGSDEHSGICPNMCKVVGDVYRKKRDEERKLRKTGAKIRSTYITFAHKEQKRLEALVQATSQEIVVREKEVARLQEIADRAESLSAAALEHMQKSPLYTSLMTHSLALKSLQREHKKHLEREKALGSILDSLRSGYNPNYQDMAVLEAVRGWEELSGLPHINEGSKGGSEQEESPESQGEASAETTAEEVPDDGMWSAERLENELDSLVSSDYVSLLLEHEEHVKSPGDDSTLLELSSYLPDSLLPYYDDARNAIVSWLQTLGLINGETDSGAADSSRARQAFNDAESTLNRVRDEKEKAQNGLANLFDVTGFGADGEWKKLEGLCLEKNTGDYTYEVCLFDEARQKPNNGGSNFSLGKFSSWNPSSDVRPGDPEYYQKQVYNQGTRCWNGPERSVVLLMTCGLENALLTVAELEKCEYQFTGTSPALCLPLDTEGDGTREEL
ncbi:glucosidase II beta subunit-like-domain-containing protein, partial [Infundibulicybe gibba]